MHLLVDSHYGIYTPATFVERYAEQCTPPLTEEDKEILSSPESELYWEVWTELVDNHTVTIDGVECNIVENDDLWAVPVGHGIEEYLE